MGLFCALGLVLILYQVGCWHCASCGGSGATSLIPQGGGGGGGGSTGLFSLVNMHNKQVIETKFLVGTASSSVTTLGIQLDSGTIQSFAASSNWTYSLVPSGWLIGSQHTITVGVYSGSGFVGTTQSISVTQGVNHDVDGNGFPDVAVASPSNSSGYIIYSPGPSGFSGTINVGTASGVAQLTPASLPTIHTTLLGDFDNNGYADLALGGVASGSGTVFVYFASTSGIASGAGFSKQMLGTDASFASSIASGDMDGDGIDDILVGDSTSSKAVVYFGNTSQVSAFSSVTTFTTSVAGTNFGFQVACGYNITALNQCNPLIVLQQSPGATVLASPSLSGKPSTVLLTGSSSQVVSTTPSYGNQIATGEFNGDGQSDLIVGAPISNSQGAAYVYLSNASGLGGGGTDEIGFTTIADFGLSVAAGDINGDGYADAVIGAFDASVVSSAYLIYSAGSTPFSTGPFVSGTPGTSSIAGSAYNSTPGLQAGIGNPYTLFASDTNGDGYLDLLLGAPNQGAAFIFNGSAANFSTSLVATNANAFLDFGSASAFGACIVQLLFNRPSFF